MVCIIVVVYKYLLYYGHVLHKTNGTMQADTRLWINKLQY